MSWQPNPTLGSANWQGNPPLATKNQLISSISGLYTDLQDLSGFTFNNLNVSTLNVQHWISTPELYVSSLYARNIDLSGIVLDPSGVFIVSDLSGNFSQFNTTLLSSLEFKFNPQVNIQINVGDATFGFLSGLGFLIFETLFGLGAGVGKAFEGIGNGIAAMIMANGSHNTYINTNNFELIGGSTQLQISTLGNMYPAYSSIMRYVSSSGLPNQVPGDPIFTSTIFYPGQICIRSISDPFPVVSGNANITGSTIQQFGEWVPLDGLEPTNILANSVSTGTLNAGNISTGVLSVTQGQLQSYNAPILFQTGATNQAKLIGYLQNLYMQTDNGFVFTRMNTATEAASMYLGTGVNESLLNVSSIYSRGNIQANTANISSIVCESLYVISTINLTSTNIAQVTSTQILEADKVYANIGYITALTPYNIVSTTLGNPTGPFDININNFVASTTYDSVSSLTQNILQSKLSLQVQDEATWVLPGGNSAVNPTNVEQWASSILVYNQTGNYQNILLGPLANWSTPSVSDGSKYILSGTFDLVVDARNLPGGTNFLNVFENSNITNPVGQSTILAIPRQPQGFYQTFRFTLQPNGWWNYTTPAPPPYATTNSNVFSIYQDINDTYIQTTDRLHLVGGDILLDGNVNFGDINVQNLNVFNTLTAQTGYFSTISSQFVYATDWISSTQFTSPTTYSGSYNNIPNKYPINVAYQMNTNDYVAVQLLTLPSKGWQGFSSYNLSEWNNTMYGTPTYPDNNYTSIICGDPIQTYPPFTPYSGQFWINNTISPPVSLAISQLTPNNQISTIGLAPYGYTRVWTTDGTRWSTTKNVSYPGVSGGGQPLSYSNSYNVALASNLTQLSVQQPLIERVPSKQIFAEKIINWVPQIRCVTFASPSYASREAGFEYTFYFDADVVFTGSQSDAVNLIRNPLGNLLYPLCAWAAQVWFSRMRTESLGIQGFDIDAIAIQITGTPGDYVWASARYINVNGVPAGKASIRENYLMIPINHYTYQNFTYT